MLDEIDAYLNTENANYDNEKEDKKLKNKVNNPKV